MYFGADYYPEHWVYPFDGTPEEPESRWEQDAQLMAHAGMNVVRMGEFCWGLSEREEGKFDFTWLRRAMDAFSRNGIKIVLSTPTAAPPVWLAQKYPEILPLDENGQPRREGTRRAYCMNSDVYWDRAKKIVRAKAEALGDHPTWSRGRSTTAWAGTIPSTPSIPRPSATGTPGSRPNTKPWTCSTSAWAFASGGS